MERDWAHVVLLPSKATCSSFKPLGRELLRITLNVALQVPDIYRDYSGKVEQTSVVSGDWARGQVPILTTGPHFVMIWCGCHLLESGIHNVTTTR